MAAQTTEGAVAVVFVVESSLALATQWKSILDYFAPLLARLHDPNIGTKLRIGFITYALAETLPSPVLCRRFFSEDKTVTQAIHNEGGKLGLGQSNSGGSVGMAALEGLVAALEMFQTLLQSPNFETAKPPVFHLIHIAASSPNASIHPLWNEQSEFDEITWATLPFQLQKRNIHYNAIMLRPKLPRFPDLFSACAKAAPLNPWFPLRPGHTCLLHGFSMVLPQKTTAKRQAEAAVDRSPEAAKRPRIQSQTNSVDRTAPLVLSKPPAAVQPTPALTTNPAVANNPPQQIPQMTPQQLQTQYRVMDEQIRIANLALQDAQSKGDTEREAAIKLDLQKKTMFMMRLKAILQTMIQKQVAGQVPNLTQVGLTLPPQPKPIPPTFGPNAVTEKVAQPTIPDMTNAFRAPQATTQVVQNQIQNPGMNVTPNVINRILPARTQQMSPNMSSQMQKLIEQQERSGVHTLGVNSTPSGPMNSSFIGQNPLMAANPMMDGTSVQQTQPQAGQKLPVWRGALAWSGHDHLGKKVVQTIVQGIAMNHVNPLADSWPKTMTLMPVPLPPLSVGDLQAWAKRTNPALVTFQPIVTPMLDKQINEDHFRGLVSMLANKPTYAVSQWQLPNGKVENNILFFPYSNQTLVGAVFPMSGILELPKPLNSEPTNAVNPMSNLGGASVMQPTQPTMNPNPMSQLVNMPKQVVEYIASMPSDHKASAIKAMMMQQLQNNPAAAAALMSRMQGMGGQGGHQQGQPEMPKAGPSINFGMANPPSFGNAGTGQMPQAMGIVQQNMMNAGMQRLPGAGGVGNMNAGMTGGLSLGLMQSFMQRNGDGRTG